jgi:hypothetical protein
VFYIFLEFSWKHDEMLNMHEEMLDMHEKLLNMHAGLERRVPLQLQQRCVRTTLSAH